MHLRGDPDHVKYGEHDMPEEIMVLGRSQHHQRHGDVLFLLVQLFVQVVVRVTHGIFEGYSRTRMALVRSDPVRLRVLEKVIIILVVLLHQILRVIIFIIFVIAYLNLRQVILQVVLCRILLCSLGRGNDRVQHSILLEFGGLRPRFVQRLRLLGFCL